MSTIGAPVPEPSSKTCTSPPGRLRISPPSIVTPAFFVWLSRTIVLMTSRTTISVRTAVRILRPRPKVSALPGQPELAGPCLHRRDHEGDVLVEVDAQLLGALAHLVAVYARRERGLLELLLDRLRGHALDPGRPDQGARADEAGQLVDRVKGLGHVRLARHAEE